MYLCASVPSMETLTLAFAYEGEKSEIEDRDYVKIFYKRIKKQGRLEVVKNLARVRSMTLDEFAEFRAERMKSIALKKLKEKFTGVLFEEKSDVEDARQAAIDRAHKVADKMKEGEAYREKFREILNNVPDGAPEALKSAFRKV